MSVQTNLLQGGSHDPCGKTMPDTAAERGPRGPIHERHRRDIVALIPAWYSPTLHLITPTAIGLSVLIFAISRVHALQPIELLAIPATLLLAFVFEWCAHKWVLHHRSPLLGVIYDRHELQHHVVFTYDDMVMQSPRELWLVLMPAYAVVLVALFNAPIAYLTAMLVSPNAGFLYLTTSMVFFLSYEWLHLAYHLPPTTFVGRLQLIARLREHHRRHHEPRLMKQWNFNVTVPAFDWVKRTLWSPQREQQAREERLARKYAQRRTRPLA
jgi:hypothetical protein